MAHVELGCNPLIGYVSPFLDHTGDSYFSRVSFSEFYSFFGEIEFKYFGSDDDDFLSLFFTMAFHGVRRKILRLTLGSFLVLNKF